jgi:hypothetical protein
MPQVERGTAAILVVDFLATMGAITFGLIYAKMDPVYLVLLSAITFGLFFVVWALLARSSKPATG